MQISLEKQTTKAGAKRDALEWLNQNQIPDKPTLVEVDISFRTAKSKSVQTRKASYFYSEVAGRWLIS